MNTFEYILAGAGALYTGYYYKDTLMSYIPFVGGKSGKSPLVAKVEAWEELKALATPEVSNKLDDLFPMLNSVTKKG